MSVCQGQGGGAPRPPPCPGFGGEGGGGGAQNSGSPRPEPRGWASRAEPPRGPERLLGSRVLFSWRPSLGGTAGWQRRLDPRTRAAGVRGCCSGLAKLDLGVPVPPPPPPLFDTGKRAKGKRASQHHAPGWGGLARWPPPPHRRCDQPPRRLLTSLAQSLGRGQGSASTSAGPNLPGLWESEGEGRGEKGPMAAPSPRGPLLTLSAEGRGGGPARRGQRGPGFPRRAPREGQGQKPVPCVIPRGVCVCGGGSWDDPRPLGHPLVPKGGFFLHTLRSQLPGSPVHFGMSWARTRVRRAPALSRPPSDRGLCTGRASPNPGLGRAAPLAGPCCPRKFLPCAIFIYFFFCRGAGGGPGVGVGVGGQNSLPAVQAPKNCF